uniref:SFRICE_030565 n=1 Tax=Spodoptera frugiperda TaxID=7108 RepID=A0A2H1W350_SPOFR
MSFSDSLKVVNFLVKELPCSRPLLDIGLSNGAPLSSIYNSTHLTTSSHLADIVTPPSWRARYTTSDEACRSDLYPAGRDLVFDIDARACVESNGNLLSRGDSPRETSSRLHRGNGEGPEVMVLVLVAVVGEHNPLKPRLVLHLNVQRALSSRETGNHRLSRIQLHLYACRRPESRRLLPGRIISPFCRIREFSSSSSAPHTKVYTVCDLLSDFQLSTNRPGVGERLRNLVEDGSVVFGLDTAVVLELSRRHDDRFGVHSQYSRSDWAEGSLYLFPVVSLVDIVPRGRTLHVHVCGRCIGELLDCPLQAPVSYVKGLPFPVADDFHILTRVLDLSF